MRIAAVDDDPLQLELFTQSLTALGHVCQTFETGAALLKALRRDTFDLLIVDWELPDTSGPDIIRWVREHVSRQLPILFVTHHQQERDIVEGLACGADDFMGKPVRVAELSARIRALLRRAWPDAASGEPLGTVRLRARDRRPGRRTRRAGAACGRLVRTAPAGAGGGRCLSG